MEHTPNPPEHDFQPAGYEIEISHDLETRGWKPPAMVLLVLKPVAQRNDIDIVSSAEGTELYPGRRVCVLFFFFNGFAGWFLKVSCLSPPEPASFRNIHSAYECSLFNNRPQRLEPNWITTSRASVGKKRFLASIIQATHALTTTVLINGDGDRRTSIWFSA